MGKERRYRLGVVLTRTHAPQCEEEVEEEEEEAEEEAEEEEEEEAVAVAAAAAAAASSDRSTAPNGLTRGSSASSCRRGPHRRVPWPRASLSGASCPDVDHPGISSSRRTPPGTRDPSSARGRARPTVNKVTCAPVI
jgi:hypothetical protein